MAGFQQLIDRFQERYHGVRERGEYFYLKEIRALDGSRVTVGDRVMIMFSSYSYLGLLGHPGIEQAARDAISRFGTGTHGVRILAGTTSLHEELERKLARFMKTEAAIAYSSGFLANTATIAALLTKDDLVVTDKLSHASIIDGCRLSHAKFLWFRHNDPADLDRILKRHGAGYEAKLVVVDAVYSMDGDVAPVPELIRVCRDNGAWLAVDEAHSLGVLGETGHGIQEYFGLAPGEIDVLTGSLSKTVPAVGGYVAGRGDFINFLKHNARGFVFSAALPPPAVAAASESLDVIEREQWRISKLRANIRRFVGGLNSLGYNTLDTKSSVIPIIIGDERTTLAISRMLHERGVFICPILPPAVPKDTCRLRANVMTSHTDEDIDIVLGHLAECGRELGVIGGCAGREGAEEAESGRAVAACATPPATSS